MPSEDGQPGNGLLKQLAPQLTLITLCVFLYSASLIEWIPTPGKINAYLLNSLKTHGLPLISLCALIENIVGLNAYFPGALAILAGMALPAGNLRFAIITYLAIYIPSYVGNWVSYFLGRKERTALGRIEAPSN